MSKQQLQRTLATEKRSGLHYATQNIATFENGNGGKAFDSTILVKIFARLA